MWKYPSPIRMRIDPVRRETLGSRCLGTSFGYGFRGQLLVSKGQKIPDVVSKHWPTYRYESGQLLRTPFWSATGTYPSTGQIAQVEPSSGLRH